MENLNKTILHYLKNNYELKFIDFDLQKTKEVNIEYSYGDNDYDIDKEIPDFYIKIEFDIFSIEIKNINYYSSPVVIVNLLSDCSHYSEIKSIEELESFINQTNEAFELRRKFNELSFVSIKDIIERLK